MNKMTEEQAEQMIELLDGMNTKLYNLTKTMESIQSTLEGQPSRGEHSLDDVVYRIDEAIEELKVLQKL